MLWLLKAVVGDEYDVAEYKRGDAENSGTSERIRLFPGGDNFIRLGRKFEKSARARVYGQKCHYLNAVRNDWRKIRRLHKQNIARFVIQSLDVQVHTFVLVIHTHCHEIKCRQHRLHASPVDRHRYRWQHRRETCSTHEHASTNISALLWRTCQLKACEA